jgi:hypothetical protein
VKQEQPHIGLVGKSTQRLHKQPGSTPQGQSHEEGYMRSIVTIAAMLCAVGVGAALAQSNPPATTGTSNPAVSTGTNKGGVDAPEAGKNSFTEAQARERIEARGLTGVTGLHKDENSIWRGTAMKDGKSVNVALDYKGDVVVGE